MSQRVARVAVAAVGGEGCDASGAGGGIERAATSQIAFGYQTTMSDRLPRPPSDGHSTMHASVDIVGYVGALLVFLAFWMKRMVPLRVVALGSNLAFLAYGLSAGAMPVWLLHTVLLPLNLWRLREVLTGRHQGEQALDWMKQFMTERAVAAGDILFQKGDLADEIYVVKAGRLRLREIGVDVEPGVVVGDLGLLAPGRRRAQTLVCTKAGTVLAMSYSKFEELYCRNPTAGFHLIRLSSSHLFERLERIEQALSGHGKAPAARDGC